MPPHQIQEIRNAKAARWRPAIVFLAAFALLWPALFNAGPFFFSDSVQYIRGPDGALGKFFGPGARSEWSVPRPALPGAPKAAADPATVGTPRSGRSIYYGVLANLGARTSDFWLTLILQAYAAVLAIDLLCRAIGWTRIRTFLLAVGVSALTPLSIYACFIMPDIFAAIMVTAAAALAAGADRLSRTDIGLGAGLIAYSAATHTSHLAILAAIIASAGLLLVVGRKSAAPKTSAAVLAVAGLASLAVAIAAGAAFDLVVKKTFGSPPIPVPFLTARMVSEHHPGEDWLKTRCPKAPFVACKFVGRLPMTSNEFLWSVDPVKSAFTTADTRDQIGLGQEQARLFVRIAEDEPLAVGRYFLKDWADQLEDFSLEGMNVNDEQRLYLDALVADRFRGAWKNSLAFRRAWPIEPLNTILGLLSLASFGAVVTLGAKAVAIRRPNDTESRLLSAALVVIAGVLANAAVCGGLSGVFGRYEARILPPLILVGFFALALLVRGKEPGPV